MAQQQGLFRSDKRLAAEAGNHALDEGAGAQGRNPPGNRRGLRRTVRSRGGRRQHGIPGRVSA